MAVEARAPEGPARWTRSYLPLALLAVAVLIAAFVLPSALNRGFPTPPPAGKTFRNTGERPQTKRCVGSPLRQTEDPMAPPCVPHFDGDNFGSTYLGVTKDEIIVLPFSAIQVAGPDLTPEAIDRGFHAIPKKKTSKSPYIAACYFDPADYTCSKDATEFWWDPVGISPDGGLAGCVRLVRGGKRYQQWEWPRADEAFGNRDDAPCSAWESRYQLRTGG